MPFNFPRFLLNIERRSRRLRGLSCSCRFLFYSSLLCIGVSLGLRWLAPDLPKELTLLALLIPFFLTGGAYLLGWWKRPNLPHLLMRLDDELDSGARISSLYEVHVRGQGSFFQDKLESLVASLSTNWKRGIIIQRRAIGFLSAGTIGVLIACAVLLLPVSFPRAASSEPPAQSQTSETQMPLSSLAETSQDHSQATSEDAAGPLQLPEGTARSQQSPSDQGTDIGPKEDLSLDSILDELSSLSKTHAEVDAAPTFAELQEMADEQGQARQEMSEMLMEMQARMGDTPRPLTQDESKTLQDLASQTGSSEIEEQADELATEPNPEQIGEKIQDLLEQVDPDSVEPETSPETDEQSGDGSGNDTPQSTEISGDEEAGQRFLERTAQQLQEQANAGADQEGGSPQQIRPEDEEDTQQPGDEGSANVPMPGAAEDLSQVGGQDGIGMEAGTDPSAEEVGFVREEAPSSIGDQGEFIDEYVTKGVPVEIASSESTTGTLLVDFDRMESILHERDLPAEAVDSIRRYFELITQPEGGS